MEVDIELPDKLIPVFDGDADIRGAYGGRGSAKTRSFATMAAVYGYRFGMMGISGLIVCGRQYMNSLEDSSLEECKRAIQDEPFLSNYYEVGEKYIKSKDGRIQFAFVGLDRNIQSIKSKGRILVLWIDEAEPVTKEAFTIIEPTLREESEGWNAELWLTWNPRRKSAAVESYRDMNDPMVKIAEINYKDNEKFPEKLERQRLRDLKNKPDQYPHIWEGDYLFVMEGAYFSEQLVQAKKDGRITQLGIDPLITIRAYCDIGGTGARSDAFVMWIVQFIGQRIHAIDYYEAVGQELSEHVNWLRSNNYHNAHIWLPHDGKTNDRVFRVSFQTSFEQAGFVVNVIENQGTGAAKNRIEAVRRKFPLISFDEEKTEAGREALAFYHEKKDENRDIGLGPEHDWSSHAADAFGEMCITHTGPQQQIQPINYTRQYLA